MISNKSLSQKFAKFFCYFLNSLAYATRSSYSFIGPYNPKKPDKLKNKN